MHARVRAHDWAATPLGPIHSWSPILKYATAFTLAAGFPTLLLWGRDLIQIYNDPYLRLMGWREVPLSASYRTSWPEDVSATTAMFERGWRGESFVMEETLYSNARREDGRPAWLTTSVSPVHNDAGAVAGLCLSIFDSTDRTLAEAKLRENEAQLAQLLHILPVGVSLFDTNGDVVMVNSEMLRLYHTSATSPVGSCPLRVFDHEGRQLEPHEFPRARALRGEVVPPEAEVLIEIDGERRWLKIGAVPFVHNGKMAGGIAVAYDVTEAKESADRMKVLVAELQHRTRNLIGMVRALADKMLEDCASLPKYRAQLTALARVQGLLSSLAGGDRVAFDTLLRAELSAHAALDDDRVTLEGPSGVRLRSQTVQTLALALHELATNATKYGALAQSQGRLAVSWRVAHADAGDGGELRVEWRESGVEMPAAGEVTAGGGYGRELIERGLPYQLRAQTSFVLGPDGVCCTIAMPIACADARIT
jgi:PAS domain S-box-containing protein